MLEQSSRDLLLVTAQLIEAACHARDGDSYGTRVHIARAVALLEGYPEPKIATQAIGRGSGQIPRGGFAAWQSRRLAAHVDANLSGKIVTKDLAASLDMSVGHFCRAFKRTFGAPAPIWIRHRRIVGNTPSSWRQTRHAAIEERVTELACPGKAKPIIIEKARRLGRC